MSSYPVTFHVDRPARYTRVQLVIRLVLFAVLGLVGLSLGAVFVLAYLALPAIAAWQRSRRDGDPALVDADVQVERALGWFAAIFAYTGLLIDAVPTRAPDPAVHLAITRSAGPDARGALWRIVTGVPSALVLALLSCIGAVVWLIAAIEILVTEQYGAWSFRFLEGLERWMLCLLAYQAGLVDAYPPFSLDANDAIDHGVDGHGAAGGAR
jgi:Domain of unknown function (DUF4389)